MAEYDGLPLNTPTKVRENNEVEVWATRSASGGTVEFRPKPNTNTERILALEDRIFQAIAANSAYLQLATPTVAQNTLQLQRLTRQIQALLRLRTGTLDSVD